MIFRRKIYQQLRKWKEVSDGKSAVMLEGARRVGKSTIVEEFAKNEYEDYLILDFATESADIRRNFEENIGDLDTFFRNLFLLKKKSLPERKSVIVFDEVQLFPLARQAIKYLVADGRYDYIQTGSLISIRQNVRNILIPSEEYRIKMFPMDFEEFLWANGDLVTFSAIDDAFQKRKPLGEGIHREIMKRFRTYMAVGGMPQAVDAFVSGQTYEQIDFMKRTILDLYREDLRKYDSDNREKASVVFQTIPEQLQNHNSHFKFSLIEKNARYKNYVDAVSFIAESMIGNECIHATEPEISLEAFADRSNFKLYMGDTGLLVTQIMRNSSETGEDIYKSLIFDRLGINQGMIMENIVAQMLRAGGHDLYFHEFQYQETAETLPASSQQTKEPILETPHAGGAEKTQKYEIDFLLVKNRKIIPIEVKSSGYRSHKSFDVFAKRYPIKIQDKYIIYTKDLKQEDGILYLPIYMTGCL